MIATAHKLTLIFGCGQVFCLIAKAASFWQEANLSSLKGR